MTLPSGRSTSLYSNRRLDLGGSLCGRLLYDPRFVVAPFSASLVYALVRQLLRQLLQLQLVPQVLLVALPVLLAVLLVVLLLVLVEFLQLCS